MYEYMAGFDRVGPFSAPIRGTSIAFTIRAQNLKEFLIISEGIREPD
jgi:hypothetical protein